MSRAPSYRVFCIPGLPLVRPGDDLAGLIISGLAHSGEDLVPGDILVVAQKLVSKAENRIVDLATVQPSERAITLAGETAKDPRLIELILSESSHIVRCGCDVLIVRHRLGFVMANAGIDQSNVTETAKGEFALLLPKDPDGSAERLRRDIAARTGIAPGVVISDSFGRPWRRGTVGVAIGAAGLPALVDRRGQTDLFGRTLKATMIAMADHIAAAATLLMGEAAEGQPVAVLRGLSFDAPPSNASALLRPIEEDLFL